MLASAAIVGTALALAFHLSVPLLTLTGIAAGGAALALEAVVALRRGVPVSSAHVAPAPRP